MREKFSNTLVPIEAIDVPKRIAKMTFSTWIIQDAHWKKVDGWLSKMLDAKKQFPLHCKSSIDLFSDVQGAGAMLPPR